MKLERRLGDLHPQEILHLVEKDFVSISDSEISELPRDLIAKFETLNRPLWKYCTDPDHRERVRRGAVKARPGGPPAEGVDRVQLRELARVTAKVVKEQVRDPLTRRITELEAKASEQAHTIATLQKQMQKAPVVLPSFLPSPHDEKSS